MHLQQNITAADKFSFEINLRNRWPIGIIFDSLSQSFILQNVMGFKWNIMHSEYLTNCIRKSTSWSCRNAFHEYDDIGFFHHSIDLLVDIICSFAPEYA